MNKKATPTLLVEHTAADAVVEIPGKGLFYNDGRPFEPVTEEVTAIKTEAAPVEALSEDGE